MDPLILIFVMSLIVGFALGAVTAILARALKRRGKTLVGVYDPRTNLWDLFWTRLSGKGHRYGSKQEGNEVVLITSGQHMHPMKGGSQLALFNAQDGKPFHWVPKSSPLEGTTEWELQDVDGLYILNVLADLRPSQIVRGKQPDHWWDAFTPFIGPLLILVTILTAAIAIKSFT